MRYFVTSNLTHNGQVYTRGSAIELGENDNVAINSLLAAGVIQTDPIGVTQVQTPEPEPVADVRPAVAGKALETGEPSIDGREPESAEDTAEDVTPGIRALSPDVRAEAPEKPKKGKKAAEKANSQAAEPEFDPSANL